MYITSQCWYTPSHFHSLKLTCWIAMSTYNELSLNWTFKIRWSLLKLYLSGLKLWYFSSGLRMYCWGPDTKKSSSCCETLISCHTAGKVLLSLNIPLSFSLWGTIVLALGQCGPLFPISTDTLCWWPWWLFNRKNVRISCGRACGMCHLRKALLETSSLTWMS